MGERKQRVSWLRWPQSRPTVVPRHPPDQGRRTRPDLGNLGTCLGGSTYH